MSPETPIYYNMAKRSSRCLQELFEGRADVRFNGSVTLTNGSEPEPDIAVIRQPQESGYRQEFSVSEGAISPLAFPEIQITLEQLLA